MNASSTGYETIHHRDWLEYVARFGYAARGIVYVLVGVIALMAAFGSGSSEGSQGALATLTDKPFGKLLLGLVGVGLIGYALWRILQAVLDADHHGSEGKGLAIRAGFIVSGVTHALLAIYALGLAFGWATGGGSEESTTQDWTGWLMAKPFGQWLVAIVGIIIIIVGIAQFRRAYRETFKRHLFLPLESWRWASPISKAGLAARGVVFLIIGGMLVLAAYRANPREAVGLEGALDKLQQQSYGPWLLGIVAIGLIAFSIYSFLEARYRRVDIPDTELKNHLRQLHLA